MYQWQQPAIWQKHQQQRQPAKRDSENQLCYLKISAAWRKAALAKIMANHRNAKAASAAAWRREAINESVAINIS
jgi:hypothetical protein